MMRANDEIGLIWPSSPTPTDLDEISQFVPSNVKWHVRGTPQNQDAELITLKNLLHMATSTNIEETAISMTKLKVDAIGYGCTSASYVRGAGGDTDIIGRISRATATPATTTSTASVLALNQLSIKRVSVLSPHIDELNVRLEAFLTANGFEVVHVRGLNKLNGIEEILPEDIFDLVTELVDRPEADGIFISCTGLRTSTILNSLEECTGKPVVSALQATVWRTLQLAGTQNKLANRGRLYAYTDSSN